MSTTKPDPITPTSGLAFVAIALAQDLERIPELRKKLRSLLPASPPIEGESNV